jgi:hypothetical protein
LPEQWTDFVTDFLSFTESAFSPELYRKWAGIAALAGSLERRVWTVVKRGYQTYPNLYIMLVGKPGTGKQIVDEVWALWKHTKNGVGPAFHVAPTSVTKATLVDNLGKAKLKRMIPGCPPGYSYSSLLVAAEEFGALFPNYDTEFLGTLNKIYNNPTEHTEERRTGNVRELDIKFPQLNIIGGEQPGRLAEMYPETFWSTGFASRTIMVYSEGLPPTDLFQDVEEDLPARTRLHEALEYCSKLYGQMRWHPDAAEKLNTWHKAGGPPTPQHTKLAHYNKRRTNLHAPKLAMLSAISRTGGLLIDPIDVTRAIEWMIEAEASMPDIFRAMAAKSDTVVIEELYYYVQSVWARQQRQPVHVSYMWEFLRSRAPSERIGKIIEVAERAGVFERLGGTDTYIPRPTLDHRLE